MTRARLAAWTKRRLRRGLRWAEAACRRDPRGWASPAASAPARALDWIHRYECPAGGICVHSCHAVAYPEVTGYLVPTLLRYGECDLAIRMLRWLVSIQRDDGAFADPHRGLPNVFDTGQVLRGLLAGVGLVPRAADAARRAANYLCAEMRDEGREGFGPRYEDAWYRGEIPESIHLYVLPPLCLAADVFEEPAYRAAAARCRRYYRAHRDALNVDALTHYLAYELEALIDLGRADLADPVLRRLRGAQRSDGGVRGVGGARWVCAPGLAQLAVCWYKLGQWEPADRAVQWLDAHQRPSGGLLGGYGDDVSYCGAEDELSWAVKFLLDAHVFRARSRFGRQAAAGIPSQAIRARR